MSRQSAKELDALGLPITATSFRRGTVTCTGTEFCRLAITETKNFARWLVEELEDRLPGFEQHLKLHITGCPNSCGQHWISDIGIEGKKLKVDGQFVDAYYFCVGGAVGRISIDCAPAGISLYGNRSPGRYRTAAAGISRLPSVTDENLRSFFARHSDSELRSCLAGTDIVR